MASEQDKAFNAERSAQLRAKIALFTDTRNEIVRLLKQASDQITLTLANQPSDYQLWQLSNLQKEVHRVIAEFGQQSAGVVSTSTGKAWQAGQDLIDKPIEAGGVKISSQLPRIDTRQLFAMREFMTERIANIGVESANKINSELALVVIGAQGPSDAIGKISGILEDKGRERATTIVRTQLGAVYSTATYERLVEAAKLLPGLEKMWRRSGKIHSRENHDAADGQRRPVDMQFLIISKNGAAIHMRYPHDPKAPASEIINCGCTLVPRMRHWRNSIPGRKPYSEDEIKRNPRKRDIADATRGQTLRQLQRAMLDADKAKAVKLPPVAEIVEYAKKSLSSTGTTRHLALTAVQNVPLIKQQTGIDVTSFIATLDAAKVKHILDSHGNEAKETRRGQRAVAPEDIALIPLIVNNPDKVTLSDKLANGALQVLVFEKVIEEENYIYLAEVRPGKKQLAPATMYIKPSRQAGE